MTQDGQQSMGQLGNYGAASTRAPSELKQQLHQQASGPGGLPSEATLSIPRVKIRTFMTGTMAGTQEE